MCFAADTLTEIINGISRTVSGRRRPAENHIEEKSPYRIDIRPLPNLSQITFLLLHRRKTSCKTDLIIPRIPVLIIYGKNGIKI